jgi:hypothetical protein
MIKRASWGGLCETCKHERHRAAGALTLFCAPLVDDGPQPNRAEADSQATNSEFRKAMINERHVPNGDARASQCCCKEEGECEPRHLATIKPMGRRLPRAQVGRPNDLFYAVGRGSLTLLS